MGWLYLQTYTNVRKEANLVSPLSGLFLELDVWIPEKKIAFEYQVDINCYLVQACFHFTKLKILIAGCISLYN